MSRFKVLEINSNFVGYVWNLIHKRWDVSLDTALTFTNNYLIRKNNAACFVACDGNKPVGMGVFQLDNDLDIDYSPWLMGLYVETEYRGRGLGYRITKKRFRWAKRLGYDLIYLDTEKAEKYHEKFGWKRTGDICYRHGIPTTIMVHKL